MNSDDIKWKVVETPSSNNGGWFLVQRLDNGQPPRYEYLRGYQVNPNLIVRVGDEVVVKYTEVPGGMGYKIVGFPRKREDCR